MYLLSPPKVINGSSHQRNPEYLLLCLSAFFKTVNNIQAKNAGLCQLYIDYLFLFLKVLSKYILIQVHVSWLVRCVVYK